MPPPSTSRIPPLLQPYTRLPPDSSLVLLTSILGASTNWVLTRFLCGTFSGSTTLSSRHHATQPQDAKERDKSDGDEETAVVLVSWMRDWAFWRSEARRAGGLDLARLAQQGRFAFVDALSELFLPQEQIHPFVPSTSQKQSAPRSSQDSSRVSDTGTPVSEHTHRKPPDPPAASGTINPSGSSVQQKGIYTLTSPRLEELEAIAEQAIENVGGPTRSSPSKEPRDAHESTSGANARPRRRVLLVLDQPDFLLAAAGVGTITTPSFPTPPATATTALSGPAPVTPGTLAATILHLRQRVHATVITAAADSALVAPAAPAPTPLETDHAAFVLGMAHQATYVMSLRLLDTGVAADVSGVVRVTVGDGGEDWDEEQGGGVEEMEALYHVARDGGVKVFERGTETG